MLRKALALGLIGVPGLAGTLVAFAGGGTFIAEEPTGIAGSPYSGVAVTQSTTVFSDGNRIVRTNTTRYYRDGQGRTRVERTFGGQDGAEKPSQSNLMITITDPVGGELYFVRPQNRFVEAMKLGPGLIAARSAAASAADRQVPFALMGIGMAIGASLSTEASSTSTSLGQKVVNGVTATGTHTVRTIPVGVLGNEKPITSTVDEWFSPDLDVPVQITQKSSIGGDVTLNLTQLVRGEPDAALFAPPAGYTVRDVSGAAAVLAGAATMTNGTATTTAQK
jgi:hypothetical protein